jgi:TPP-dependent pyruvate/acetoin dehydrogenase alpha subunit
MASWIPSGAGFALAFKYRKQPRVYVALTGDGATSPGDFYEGLNFAAIHKLPLVIVVENNCYAYSTPTRLQMPVANVADRAPAFNIPSAIGFGNDIFEVRRLVSRAIDHARSGLGPYLVEFKTFRVRGHGEHDDMAYVPPDLRAFWARRDPVRMLREYLLGAGGWPPADVEAIDVDCAARTERAVDEAAAMPDPNPDTVSLRLFAD